MGAPCSREKYTIFGSRSATLVVIAFLGMSPDWRSYLSNLHFLGNATLKYDMAAP